MVKCDRCGREFNSEAALKDHLRDSQVHRESAYIHKKPYGKWALTILVLVVICGVAFFAYKGSPLSTSQTGSTSSQVNSNTVLNRSFNITSSGTWFTATLNPLYKPGYNATGSITLLVCPYSVGEIACPSIEMWVMNATGFSNYQKSGTAFGTYGDVVVTPTVSEQSPFTLQGLNYDGTYYFVVNATNQGNILYQGTYVTLSITLTESWA